MLTDDELFNFHKGPTYVHILTVDRKQSFLSGPYFEGLPQNSVKPNESVDLSIFTKDEATCIKKIMTRYYFTLLLSGQEDASTRMWKYYSNNNPNRQINIDKQIKLYKLKNELKTKFNIDDTRCMTLDSIIKDQNYNAYDYLQLYEKIKVKYGENNVTKDGLRKWFVDNIQVIEEVIPK